MARDSGAGLPFSEPGHSGDMTLLRKSHLRSAAAALFGILLLIIFFLPHTPMVSAFVTIASVIGSLGAILCGLTFWTKARVLIGRLKFRFKAVRRWAGVTALVFLSFLAMQRVAFHVWNTEQPLKSSVPPGSEASSVTARVALAATGQSPSPEEQSRDTERQQATQLNAQGLTLLQHGRYPDAEMLFKRALAIDEKAQGPEHPDVASILNNLAAVYDDEGRYAEAEPLDKRALAIQEKAWGPMTQKSPPASTT